MARSGEEQPRASCRIENCCAFAGLIAPARGFVADMQAAELPLHAGRVAVHGLRRAG